MTRQVLNNPLNKEQTATASAQNLFFLVKAAVMQHAVDGGVLLPAGRMVLIMPRRKPKDPNEYYCLELSVAAPDRDDPQAGLHGTSVLKAPKRKPFRVLVVPWGKELEVFDSVCKPQKPANFRFGRRSKKRPAS